MTASLRLAQAIGYTLRSEKVTLEVLTHSSLLNEPEGKGRTSNMRLAQVGDAVVGLAVRAALFHQFPAAGKDQLSKDAAHLVSNVELAKVASSLDLGTLLESGGSLPQATENETALAEIFEAAIGAVFLDSDFRTATAVVTKHVALPTSL